MNGGLGLHLDNDICSRLRGVYEVSVGEGSHQRKDERRRENPSIRTTGRGQKTRARGKSLGNKEKRESLYPSLSPKKEKEYEL